MDKEPIKPLKLTRQNAYYRDKYYRYYELIDTIEEQKKKTKNYKKN